MAKLSAWETASFPSSLYNLRTPEIGTHWKIPLTVRPGKTLSKETILRTFQFAASSSYFLLAVRKHPREDSNLRKQGLILAHGYSLLWWGRHGCRDVRWIVTLCLPSENTERNVGPRLLSRLNAQIYGRSSTSVNINVSQQALMGAPTDLSLW